MFDISMKGLMGKGHTSGECHPVLHVKLNCLSRWSDTHKQTQHTKNHGWQLD